jgi:hypothetical protein
MPKRKSRKKKKVQTLPPLMFIAFSLLVLILAVGLDYIGWKKGERSYLFSTLAKKKKAPLIQDIPDQILRKNLDFLSIPSEAIQEYKDKKGDLHIMIDLPLKKYTELEFLLQKEFQKAKINILEKEEQQGVDKNYYLWQTEGEKKERMTILFSCHREKVKEEAAYEKTAENKVAIIIDDMGYSLKAINDICSLRKPLTVSILPFGPIAKETARIAHQNNLEVMLHLPLESVNSQEGNDIEGIISSRMGEEEIKRTVEADLDQVPYISGVNNHMGSKITADQTLMHPILEFLKKRNLFFVDSRTTAQSIAYDLAQKLGIPTSYRHIFLDGENNESYIKKKLIELFRLAQRNGEAVGICHPTQETLKVLKENLHSAEKFNIKLVFASQVVR